MVNEKGWLPVVGSVLHVLSCPMLLGGPSFWRPTGSPLLGSFRSVPGLI